ncbi:MAG: arsenosugar biosynthesis radical SAM protein ArsS [Candidatus Cloacimonetes bacterium]|nr:arsenosugar biosynthesis radical SAM protein ArsS [Candidatus Cloacimonadota bacterium]
MQDIAVPVIKRTSLDILQVNLTKVCNLSCTHCHVQAGPKRTEDMSPQMIQALVKFIEQNNFKTLDLTGGAPELNAGFKTLIETAKKKGMEIIDRCNLTVLLLPSQKDTIDFLKDNNVHIIASLPCYTQKQVDLQRGDGVFSKSIKALKLLNQAGYGIQKGLTLDFVYNPGGPFLAGDQLSLEKSYKQRLKDDFDIEFSNLFTLHNFPVGRFKDHLRSTSELVPYMDLLKSKYNPDTLDSLMCKSQLSISWDGRIFDCDFHQMENLALKDSKGIELNIINGVDINEVMKPIPFFDHCFACTAGAGASCTGSLA